MATLAAVYATGWTDGKRFREEFLAFLQVGWELQDHQLDWCREILLTTSVPAFRARTVLWQVMTFLPAGDATRLVRGLRWLGATTGQRTVWTEVMERVCAELGLENGAETPDRVDEVLDAFFALGLEPTFRREHVRRVFRQRMRSVHPDRMAGLSGRREEAEDLAKLLNRAREVIQGFWSGFGAKVAASA